MIEEVVNGEYLPPCSRNPDLFFSPEEDGRTEVGRTQRETICKSYCFRCKVRVECLQAAIANAMSDGVWGGMGEGERRQFMKQLRSRGFDPETIQTSQLRGELRRFYARRYYEG